MSEQLDKLVFILVLMLLPGGVFGQAPTTAPTPDTTVRYLDQIAGVTADQAVVLALENNAEILAVRKEVEAARAMVKQSKLRPNPTLNATGARQLGGMDNNQMAEVMLPLELGGRRSARIAVAQKELEAREFDLTNRERLLAADVRIKFGEAVASIKKINVTERTLTAARQGYDLVAARVTEGKIAPLEQNIFLVEVNRLQSIRETAEGKVETAMFELRNMIGMRPDEPLRLRGDFTSLIQTLPSLIDSTNDGLIQRPDLQGARAVRQLAEAKIEQARAEGRADASVKSGYQRMNSGFPVSGFDDRGLLRPVQDVFHFFTFGVEITLPVRNRNQGAIEAAVFERDAAQSRVEFGELTIRREVASTFARYNRAARSLSIFQNGVRDQANANLQVIWQTYELGSRTLLDYIAEQRRFLDVENELVDRELETYIANVEILKAVNAPQLTKK
ncbi:MAG TPA: TolC family protein [Pyrinomonadaceae bacterium]|nr:TolC family protein [Chloracidobacterium sp.]HQZ97473.1 TolC family protein [Pyrinomonadaceae bacterium]